jgi:hypothetical protein
MDILLTILFILGCIVLAGIVTGLILSIMLIALVSGTNGEFELDMYDEDDLHDYPQKESEKL